MESNYCEGVIYDDADYAGFISRLVILVVDLFIVLLVLIPSLTFDNWLYEQYYSYNNFYATYAALLISYLYLTVVKISKFGTLGQILTKTKIETINGTRPGQTRMTLRLLFWFFAPINVITDIVFLSLIKEKRSIRDCYCNTIVIRRNATPIKSNAPIHITRVFALGLNLMYRSCYNENS